jgi:predicted nucleotidyltransferase
MIINLINQHSAKILLFLGVSPGSRYTRKDIFEKTEINNVPLDSSLTELSNFKLILFKDKLYSLNLENNLVKEIMSEISELKSLPLKVQFIVLEFIGKIIKLKGIKKIILFGSYAKLIYSEKSDIDIAIIHDFKKEGIKKKISLVADKIGRKHKKKIEEHFFSEKDMKHKEDPLIKDILRNGRVLVG